VNATLGKRHHVAWCGALVRSAATFTPVARTALALQALDLHAPPGDAESVSITHEALGTLQSRAEAASPFVEAVFSRNGQATVQLLGMFPSLAAVLHHVDPALFIGMTEALRQILDFSATESGRAFRAHLVETLAPNWLVAAIDLSLPHSVLLLLRAGLNVQRNALDAWNAHHVMLRRALRMLDDAHSAHARADRVEVLRLVLQHLYPPRYRDSDEGRALFARLADESPGIREFLAGADAEANPPPSPSRTQMRRWKDAQAAQTRAALYGTKQ
jgi:hypothetical protein